MRLFFLSLLIVLSGIHARVFGLELNISLYNERSVTSLLFTPIHGNYFLVADGRLTDTLRLFDPVYMTVFGEFVMISQSNGHSGIYRNVHFGTDRDDSEFLIRPLNQNLDSREYNGRVSFSVEYSRMKMINRVHLELYVAAVVEAESGNSSRPEFYKAQAVLCRTYALKHLKRHEDEGFNLCDEVHCQVYKGRLKRNPVILEATIDTWGMVVVDADTSLITGAFHANCGGQTVNSEDVWVSARPYLRSVKDPYCVKVNNRKWERNISLDEWKIYLISSGFSEGILNNPAAGFRFDQPTRKVSYSIIGESLPLAKIRNDWRLRSAFFSLEMHPNAQEIVLKGKGYGHGIGMCQEGGMQMAVEGKTWREIIDFYFRGVTAIEFLRTRDFTF